MGDEATGAPAPIRTREVNALFETDQPPRPFESNEPTNSIKPFELVEVGAWP
jgi:hypothetical protein